jgi:hypothetical protein
MMGQRARQAALAEDTAQGSAKKKPPHRSGLFTTGTWPRTKRTVMKARMRNPTRAAARGQRLPVTFWSSTPPGRSPRGWASTWRRASRLSK